MNVNAANRFVFIDTQINETSHSTPSKRSRSYPEPSLWDSCIGDANGNWASPSGDCEIFSDVEIIEVHPITRREQLLEDFPRANTRQAIYAEYSKHNKTIIQQQSTANHVDAAIAMLIMDNGKKCDPEELMKECSGASNEHIVWKIKNAGLTPFVSENLDLDALAKALDERGSAIVSIDIESDFKALLPSHTVIVDDITDQVVRLRDPYHGWEVSVTREAFAKRYTPYHCIQIDKK